MGIEPDSRRTTANNATRGKLVGLLACNLLAILLGLVAVVFRGLIAAFHNLLVFGQCSFDYDANAHTPPQSVARDWASCDRNPSEP